MATQIRVVETSLYVTGEEHTRVLRHLGIRAGDDGDFIECHWGPAEGSFREGFLNCGEGEISDSPYMGVFPCGTNHPRYFHMLRYLRTLELCRGRQWLQRVV